MARRRTSSAVVVAALLLAGCGGGNKQSAAEQAVANALQGYLTAFAHGNYGAACASLTDDAKARIARRSRAATLALAKTGCPAQLRALVTVVPEPQRDQVIGIVANSKVGKVEITDGRATAAVHAKFNGRTQDQPVPLLLVNGVWKVDASPNPQ